MSIASVTGSKTATVWSGTVSSPQTVSPGVATTIGNKGLVWAFIGKTAPGTVTVTDNSTQSGTANVYTRIGSTVTNTNISVTLFYCDYTRSVLATDAISVAWTGSAGTSQLNVSEWSGMTSGTVAASVSASGNSVAPTTTALTTSTVGDLVMGAFGLSAQVAYAVSNDGQGNTMTSLHAPTAANFHSSGVEFLVESASLAYNPAGPSTWAGSNWVAFGFRANASVPAPVCTGSPTVTGNISVGQTLSTTTGTWTGDISSGATYQWQRDVAGNNVYSNIASATASTYVLVGADATCNVRSAVTETGLGGSTLAYSNTVGPIVATAPVNTVAPAVTGTVRRGSTLTTSDGTWANTPTGYTYIWQRDVAGNGTFSTIGSATASTYVLAAADVLNKVRAVVTASNAAGSATANSNQVGVIGGQFTETTLDVGVEVCANDVQDTYTPGPAASVPANSVLPAVTGNISVGSTLTTTNGTWANSPTAIGYQWQRDNVGGSVYGNISGAASVTYVLLNIDDGCHLRCVVTATNSAGSAPANSNIVGTIVQPAPANTVAPAVTGNVSVGQTLTTTDGTWSNMAGVTPTFTYQWQRDTLGNGSYASIPVATASTYFLQDSDDGCRVRCVVTATNTGSAVTANSNPVGLVVQPVPTNDTVPVVSGTVQTGFTLTTDNGTWENMTGYAPLFTYVWQSSANGTTGWASIAAATSSSYDPDNPDIGAYLRSVVTATNTGGSASASSAASAVVTLGVFPFTNSDRHPEFPQARRTPYSYWQLPADPVEASIDGQERVDAGGSVVGRSAKRKSSMIDRR